MCENGPAMKLNTPSLLVLAAALLVSRAAAGASVTIQAGQTYSLGSADLVLNGADSLDANGTVASPCTNHWPVDGR